MSRFFIVGCPRSGTTLLQSLLASHEQVAVTAETHFVHRFLAGRSGFEILDPDGMEQECERFATLMGSDDEADLVAMRARLESKPPCRWSILAAFMDSTADAESKSVVGEKTPRHVRALAQLGRAFPEARFIHIHRDPRAVVLSLQGVPWSRGAIEGDAANWRDSVVAARKQGGILGKRLIHVGYEDLVAHPNRTLHRVFGHLGLEPPTGGAKPTRQGFDPVLEPWKGRAEQDPDPTRIDRWVHTWTPSQIARIEAVTWPEMDRWGYGRRTSLFGWMGAAAWYTVRRMAWRLKIR